MGEARLAAALIVLAGVAACAQPSFERETPSASAPAETDRTRRDPAAPAADRTAIPPPTVTEAAQAVARVFGSVVTVDARSGQGFVAADLNGDASQDLAVVVRPDPHRLAEINDDLANWILQDPVASADALAAAAHDPRPARVRIEAGDLLLAVIPGLGPAGWREDSSRHGLLLRNAAGEEMESLPLEKLMPAGPGRTFSGDALRERIGTRRGFIYWTGAKYLWRDAR
jgi:hypothetical protein